MGESASSFISSNTCRKLIPRILFWVGIVLAVLVGVSTLMAHFLISQIESRLDVRVKGKPAVFLIPGIISLSKASVNYGTRFQIDAKKILIYYSPWRFVTLSVPVRISGREMNLCLSPELQALDKSFQKDEIPIDGISGDLIVNFFRGIEIRSLDVDSKVIQFHLGPRKNAKDGGEGILRNEEN